MQGFNMGRYYAPSTSTAPTFNPTNPLGARAKPNGGLVVRFEMPFAIWCTSCAPHETLIGQGVRFNATKRRVGRYHSTPVWEFEMRHAACGGGIVVRTDPRTSEYLVVKGGRRRDYGTVGGDGDTDGEVLTAEERERRRGDAFAAFEGKVGERERAERERSRIEVLKEEADRRWEDPYALNRRLRREFRVGRAERRREEGVREALADKYGLSVEVVDEDERDKRRAGLVEFGESATDDADTRVLSKAATRPLFRDNEVEKPKPKPKPKRAAAVSKVAAKATPAGKTKAAAAADQRRNLLHSRLKGNTRAVIDPFLSGRPRQRTSVPVFAGLKTKRGQLVGGVADGGAAAQHAMEGEASSGRRQQHQHQHQHQQHQHHQHRQRRVEQDAGPERRDMALALVDYDSE